MKVISLSGPSGTGKSTSAIEFAFKNGIEAIIDDGILIKSGEKLAGISAKFEKNALTAVRRAVFQDEKHRQDVINAIKQNEITSILIIGTSDKMTKRIAKALQIEPIQHFYHIEDIRSKKEIEIAKFIRTTQGKHVMPIPVRQVEQNFFKRLVQKGREIVFNAQKIGEITIVRPDFHQEIIDIHKNVYVQIIQYELSIHPYVAKVDQVKILNDIMPDIRIVLYLKAPITYYIPLEMFQLQKQIAESFKFHFGVEPDHIQLTIKGIK